MILAHFIRFKGRGVWVLILPLLTALILFEVADVLSYNDKYIGALSFVISGIILFLIDNVRKTAIEGDIIQKTIKLPREKGINTFMWIEVRYWGILCCVIGLFWFLDIV